MHLRALLILQILFVLSLPLSADEMQATSGQGWKLVWNDEFESDRIDPDKWERLTDCWGGGNNEQQCYTDRAVNSYAKDGFLIIRAQRETFTGPAEPVDWETDVGNRTLPFTSARLRTMGKGDWKYGRIEVRALVPGGQGIWPAIWMLPTDWTYGDWAASGEIDIMEAVNLPPQGGRKAIHGTLHYGREWPKTASSGTSFQFGRTDPMEEFHTYAIEWSEDEIRWYVDDIHFATQTSDGWYTQVRNVDGSFEKIQANAPFDQRFHLILNVAVGGNWPGEPDDSTVFPVEMKVDFVRVFSCPEDPNSLSSCETRNRSATLAVGRAPRQSPPNELIEKFSNADEIKIFDDDDASPFEFGHYVRGGALEITQKPVPGRGLLQKFVSGPTAQSSSGNLNLSTTFRTFRGFNSI